MEPKAALAFVATDGSVTLYVMDDPALIAQVKDILPEGTIQVQLPATLSIPAAPKKAPRAGRIVDRAGVGTMNQQYRTKLAREANKAATTIRSTTNLAHAVNVVPTNSLAGELHTANPSLFPEFVPGAQAHTGFVHPSYVANTAGYGSGVSRGRITARGSEENDDTASTASAPSSFRSRAPPSPWAEPILLESQYKARLKRAQRSHPAAARVFVGK